MIQRILTVCAFLLGSLFFQPYPAAAGTVCGGVEVHPPKGCARVSPKGVCPPVIYCGGGAGHPGHPKSNEVIQNPFVTDTGGWIYHNSPSDPEYGQLQANCNHSSLAGLTWKSH